MIAVIEFGPKFTQAHMEDIFRKRVELAGSSYWEHTFSEKEIVFDLTLTEWVSAEQIAFLFAWIKNLKASGRNVKVKVPFRNNLAVSGYLSSGELKKLAIRYKTPAGEYRESEERMRRRERCGIFLLVVWGMIDQVGLRQETGDLLNMPGEAEFNRDVRRLLENNHQILPFSAFDLSVQRQQIKYDYHFQELINNNLGSTVRTRRVFDLQKNIQDLLKKYACYSPFESKILSNIITQELYINSLQHGDHWRSSEGMLSECYMTAALSNSWRTPHSLNFIPSFTEEKYAETLDFYKDKIQIKRQMDVLLAGGRFKLEAAREANLGQYAKDFLNRSYLEFTFLDFGVGIPASLRDRFRADMTDSPSRRDQLSPGFMNAAEDSQILEYAFLMDTSRNPLDHTIGYYELVPRGLYFLVDMIRRYKGLLIVRSGHGKISYDFSDRIFIEKQGTGLKALLKTPYKLSEAVRHVGGLLDNFPGTMFTIILPERADRERQKHQDVLPPVRAEQSILANYVFSISGKDFRAGDYPIHLLRPASYEYIGILFLYNKIVEGLRDQRGEVDIVSIYNQLFLSLNGALDAHQGKSCVIFFDFAGSRPGNPAWIKILYFLLNTPKINELTKAVIVNLPTDEDKLIGSIKANLTVGDGGGRGGPFMYRPIPCIHFSATAESKRDLVNWIGLKDPSDEKTLTDLLLGDGDSYSVDALTIPENTEGNIFIKFDGRLSSAVSNFDQLRETFLSVRRAAIARFIGDHVESGIDRRTGETKYVYLAANGGYQFDYLTFYEILHDKYISSFFAKCLLDRYCQEIEAALAIIRKGCTDEVEWVAERKKKLAAYRFTKIIAVTVSSQLIGIAIRDLIEQDKNYSFLRITQEKGLDKAPELIMLSSYYSFAAEKPFERIGPADKVLIVNDVISTGRLVSEILTQINDKKQIAFTGVFSILDSRIPSSEKESEEEMDSIFFSNNEKLFFTLCSFDDRMSDERIVLRKYKAPYVGEAVRKRINPLLNTVVELKVVHSEQQKILMPDMGQIIKDDIVHDDYFKIGHFQQNLSHNAYITNMRSLFEGADGATLLKEMKNAMDKLRLSTGKNNDEVIVRISEALHKLEGVAGDLLGRPEANELRSMVQLLGGVKERLIDNNFERIENLVIQPDFIFYPHFSGIEKVTQTALGDIFGTHPDHIIGLQRFDTPKGWRFPFPARRYNELTRNKDVMILDSGLLTGESMIQLIDNIAFLDVRSITVLAVVTRVDDFHREFYSRLRSLKVKRLKGKQAAHGSAEERIPPESDHVVPLEIIFGICLNIPVFASTSSCPFCEELQSYKTMLDANYPQPTTEVKKYIDLRRAELKCLQSAREVLENVSYMPRRRHDDKVDSKRIFHARDLLGRIDSYRFYPEYFDWAEKLEKRIRDMPGWISDADLQLEVEAILACLLHEPMLQHVVNNLAHGLLLYFREYVDHAIFSTDNYDTILYYKWELYPLVRLNLILSPKSLYRLSNFERILSYNDRKTRLYLHYYCWNILYHAEKYEAESLEIDTMLRSFASNMQKNDRPDSVVYRPPNDEFYKMAASRYKLESIQNYKYLDRPFNNLSLYIHKGRSIGRHLMLKRLVNDVYDAVNSTAPVLAKIRTAMRALNDEFSVYLKPNIEKIGADENLADYAEAIYRQLVPGPTGILYYIRRIGDFYAEINEGEEEDMAVFLEKAKELKQLCNFLINDVLKVDGGSNSFFGVCGQYPCDLKLALKEVGELCREKGVGHAILQDESIERLMIGHHTLLFQSMLRQLVENAIRVHSESKIAEPLELYFRYEAGAAEPGTVRVVYTQNFPFRKSEKLGGLDKLIRHYTVAFRGDFSDNREQLSTEYSVTLTFNLYKYEENLSKEELDRVGEGIGTE